MLEWGLLLVGFRGGGGRVIVALSSHCYEEIGAGACSRVWLARWNGKQVAVKMFNENYASFSENEFGSELAIMSVLRHPNICHAIGGSQIPGNRFLVMPLARCVPCR